MTKVALCSLGGDFPPNKTFISMAFFFESRKENNLWKNNTHKKRC